MSTKLNEAWKIPREEAKKFSDIRKQIEIDRMIARDKKNKNGRFRLIFDITGTPIGWKDTWKILDIMYF